MLDILEGDSIGLHRISGAAPVCPRCN